MTSNGPFGNDRPSQFSALMVAHLANDLRLLLGAILNCVDSIRAKIPPAVDVDEDLAAFETASIDTAPKDVRAMSRYQRYVRLTAGTREAG